MVSPDSVGAPRHLVGKDGKQAAEGDVAENGLANRHQLRGAGRGHDVSIAKRCQGYETEIEGGERREVIAVVDFDERIDPAKNEARCQDPDRPAEHLRWQPARHVQRVKCREQSREHAQPQPIYDVRPPVDVQPAGAPYRPDTRPFA